MLLFFPSSPFFFFFFVSDFPNTFRFWYQTRVNQKINQYFGAPVLNHHELLKFWIFGFLNFFFFFFLPLVIHQLHPLLPSQPNFCVYYYYCLAKIPILHQRWFLSNYSPPDNLILIKISYYFERLTSPCLPFARFYMFISHQSVEQ